MSVCGRTAAHHQTRGWAVAHTHTHLSLLMSTYVWDPPLKSSNLFHITWETEQNTKLWKERKTIIQSRVQLEVVKLRLTAFPTGKRVLIWRLVIVTLLTFCLPSIFGWCIWIWTVFFYALLNECVWEACRRFAFWQARACSESGDVEVCGRIRWETHTQTYAACRDRERNASHTVTLAGRGLLEVILPQFRSSS